MIRQFARLFTSHFGCVMVLIVYKRFTMVLNTKPNAACNYDFGPKS